MSNPMSPAFLRPADVAPRGQAWTDVSDVARVEPGRTYPMSPSVTRPADVILGRGEETILAIDPGTVQSAWLLFADGRPVDFGIWPNAALLDALRSGAPTASGDGQFFEPDVAVIEQVASYGMPVGAEVFETVRWSGRFEEALHPTPVVQLTRKTIVLHLCNSPRATDSNVRRALMDKFGGDASIGLKRSPGPLYGFHTDLWAALAVAVAYAEGAKPTEKKP